MDDTTSLLLGLDSFRVVDVVRVAELTVQVVIDATQGLCPDCGQPSERIKERPSVRVRDLPIRDSTVVLWWRKRRLYCREPSCPRETFTQTAPEIPPRSGLTTRLRRAVAHAIGSNRAVSEVAAQHRLAWHTAHRTLIAAAAGWLAAPAPTRVLGIDETRARCVRWLLEGAGWRRSDRG